VKSSSRLALRISGIFRNKSTAFVARRGASGDDLDAATVRQAPSVAPLSAGGIDRLGHRDASATIGWRR